jgi:hypothetical protein
MKKRISFKSFEASSFPLLISHRPPIDRATEPQQIMLPTLFLKSQPPSAGTQQDLYAWLNSGLTVAPGYKPRPQKPNPGN